MTPSLNRPRRSDRRGLSLLEVVMAVAIMGLAMAIIGNLVRLGSRNAGITKWQSQAQILCDAKMAEVSSGVLPLENIARASISERPEWTYTVEVQDSDLTGLLKVSVTVQPSDSSSTEFSPYRLTRLIPDPNYEPEQGVVQ